MSNLSNFVRQGTVSSIGLAVPAGFSVTGPITTAGTITIGFAAGQSPNLVLATQTSGTGPLVLRGLVLADLPPYTGAANLVMATPDGSSGNVTPRALVTADIPGVVAATASTIVKRGSDGTITGATPTLSTHLTTKAFVDTITTANQAAIAAINNRLAYPAGFPNHGDKLGRWEYNGHMIVKMSDGSLIGWGYDGDSNLSTGLNAGNYSLPQQLLFDPVNPPPAGATVADFVMTSTNTYVVMSNGWVYACGQNASGQLGQGDTTIRPLLTRIDYFVTNSITITKVYAAVSVYGTTAGSALFIANNNKVYGCGNNSTNQLGIVSTSNQLTPVQVFDGSGSPITDICMTMDYYGHSSWLLCNGVMYGTGYNNSGQLATNDTTTKTTWTAAVSAPANITAIKAVGGNYYNSSSFNTYTVIMALTAAAGGSLYTCGFGGSGKLGNGATADTHTFGSAILTNVADFGGSGAYYGNCYAIKNNGDLYTWGSNYYGGIFQSNTTQQNTPTKNFQFSASKVWIHPSNYNDYRYYPTSPMLVLTTTGKLYISMGSSQAAWFAGVVADPTHGTGNYLVPMPNSFTNGVETIVDVYSQGYTTTGMRFFVLSNLGNLYSLGINQIQLDTGMLTSGSNTATHLWSRIRVDV